MKQPSLSMQRQAVERAVGLARNRTSVDEMQRDHLQAAASTIGALEELTTDQLHWLSTPGAAALVRAAYEARNSGGVVMRNIGGRNAN